MAEMDKALRKVMAEANAAFAKMGQRLLGDPFGFERHTHVTHGLDSSI